MQVFDGPSVVNGETAINNMAALNELGGWDKALTATGTARRSQGLARQAAHAYRKAMDEAFNKLPVGAEEITANLEQAKALLQERSRIFWRTASKAGARSVERHGDLSKLRNDPAAFQAWWGQVDEPLRAAGKAQLIDKLMGFSPKQFAKNWTELPVEIKQTAFTPEQIQAGDSIVKGGEEALKSITAKYAAWEDLFIDDAMKNVASLSKQRTQLAGLSENIVELEQKVSSRKLTERVIARQQLEQAHKTREAMQAQLADRTFDERLAFTRRMREARDKVESSERLSKAGWQIGQSAIGGTALYGIVRAVKDALGSK